MIVVDFNNYIQYHGSMGYQAKAETAADHLRRNILNGTHLPGEPLRMAALSARYGVSATPLREALTRLEGQGLVVAEANCGWRVAPVSLAGFEDLQLARLTLETALLQDAMAHGGVEWEAGIVAAHYRLAQAEMPLGANDSLAARQHWMAVHDAFHLSLAAAARSDWLRQFYRQLLDQLQRHHQAVLCRGPFSADDESMMRDALSLSRHSALMSAVLNRDKTAAMAMLHDHNADAQAIFGRILGQSFPASRKAR